MIAAELDMSALQKLNQNIGLRVRYLGVVAEDSVKQMVGNLADVLTHSTPPYVINAGSVPKTDLAGKKRGEDKVRIDILRLIKPVQDVFGKKPKNERIAKMIRRRDTEGMIKVLSTIKDIKNPKIVPFDESYHTSHRGNGRYRVRKTAGTFTWDRTATHAYVKEVQARVGFSKSGWHFTAVAYGKAPIGWVARHFPYTKGWFLEHKGSGVFSVTISNTAPDLSRHKGEYNKAVVSLGHRMMKDFETRLNYLIKTGKIPNAST